MGLSGDSLSWFSICVTVVLSGFSIYQASQARKSADAAERRANESLEATKGYLAKSDENTIKLVEATHQMIRDLLDDPEHPKFGKPVKDEDGFYTGGNAKNAYISIGALIDNPNAHGQTFQPEIKITSNNPGITIRTVKTVPIPTEIDEQA